MLKMTSVDSELLSDIDMPLLCEKGIRGDTSMIVHRHAEANNKYMKSYNPDKKSSHIIYLDANNPLRPHKRSLHSAA